LTLDPNYVWHTFYGSSYEDYGYGIAVDRSGNVYVMGYSSTTWQGDGPIGPLHAHSGSDDIVVVKLTSAGAYQWHTFYGSSNSDEGFSIAVDSSSNVYVAGVSYATWQGDGPTNPLHAYSEWYDYSGWYDIVALKLLGAPTGGTCTASGSGNWSDPATWGCGHAPEPGEAVVIPAGFTVTLNQDIELDSDLDVQGRQRRKWASWASTSTGRPARPAPTRASTRRSSRRRGTR
jgi:hypothetical protein